jgi:hypothetical protein
LFFSASWLGSVREVLSSAFGTLAAPVANDALIVVKMGTNLAGESVQAVVAQPFFTLIAIVEHRFADKNRAASMAFGIAQQSVLEANCLGDFLSKAFLMAVAMFLQSIFALASQAKLSLANLSHNLFFALTHQKVI